VQFKLSFFFRIALQARNDKPGEHPPAPFKGGTFGHSSPFEGGRGMFLLFVISSEVKQSREPDSVRINGFVIISFRNIFEKTEEKQEKICKLNLKYLFLPCVNNNHRMI